MNCEWVKENIVLCIYDELADDAKFEFEHHVRHCLPCRHELESALEFKQSMNLCPVQEVSPSFLTESRMKLQEALEHTEQSRGWGRWIFDFSGWLQQIKLAPALTMALLMAGFAGGILTSYRMRPQNMTMVPISAEEASIADVQSIVADPNSSRISITYNTLKPQMAEGSSSDPKIRQLLLLAARDPQNSGVRLDAFNLLTQKPQNDEVREALIYAVRYDRNPGVRLRALEGLKGFVRDDIHVRDAVLEALLHDTNAGVRQEDISLLDPVKADMSVREALRVLAGHDQNKFIRSESKRVLASTPHLE